MDKQRKKDYKIGVWRVNKKKLVQTEIVITCWFFKNKNNDFSDYLKQQELKEKENGV